MCDVRVWVCGRSRAQLDTFSISQTLDQIARMVDEKERAKRREAQEAAKAREALEKKRSKMPDSPKRRPKRATTLRTIFGFHRSASREDATATDV